MSALGNDCARRLAMGVVLALVAVACTRAPLPTSSGGPPGPSPNPSGSPSASSAESATEPKDTPDPSAPDVMSRVWFAPIGDTWVVADPTTHELWPLRVGEIPVDSAGDTLLTVTTELGSRSSTIRRYIWSTRTEQWRYVVTGGANEAAFLGDGVVYAPTGGGDGGVWLIESTSDGPKQVIAPETNLAPVATRSQILASPTHLSVASELASKPDEARVDLISKDGRVSHVDLPAGFSLSRLTDSVLIADSRDAIIGLSFEDGQEPWRLPIGGISQGMYLSNDARRLIVARFDPKGSGDLELLSVPTEGGDPTTVHVWAGSAAQPHFWPDLSSDAYAVFSKDYTDLDDWAASGGGPIAATLVDLAGGSLRQAIIQLSVHGGLP